MGNQPAVFKNRNDSTIDDKKPDFLYENDFTNQVLEQLDNLSMQDSIFTRLASNHHPIHVTVNRQPRTLDKNIPYSASGSQLVPDTTQNTNRTRNRMYSCNVTGYSDCTENSRSNNNLFNPHQPFTVPTVFKWTTKSTAFSIYVSGSFNSWKQNIPLSKYDDSSFYTIVDCVPGTHVFKFLIDGAWKHDPNQHHVKNLFGTYDNLMEVKYSDFLVIDALSHDENWSSRRKKNQNYSSQYMSGAHSPPGRYHAIIPTRAYEECDSRPPHIPHHLNQSILDSTIPANVEPSLLPTPQHVKLQHLYASSIKDGLICLSTTIRYRSKFITIIMHRSI